MKIARLSTQPEIFYTIQGEGKNMGRPSIFVRASLCNLHCVWCDTDYTWNWEGTRFKHVRDNEAGYHKYRMEAQIIEMHPEEVVQEVRKYPCRHLVLTGGEPLMQQADFVAVMRLLRSFDREYTFEVETNGTLKPSLAFDAMIGQYNVSPKTSNSGNKPALREKPKVLQYLAENEKAVFKFVVAKKGDLKEILELVERYKMPGSRIYLMPEGTSAETLKARQQWLVEVCKSHGFNYTDRLHVHIYGSKRGV